MTRPHRYPEINPLNISSGIEDKKYLIYEITVDSSEDIVIIIVIDALKMNTIPEISERIQQSFLRRCEPCNTTIYHHSDLLLVFLRLVNEIVQLLLHIVHSLSQDSFKFMLKF